MNKSLKLTFPSISKFINTTTALTVTGGVIIGGIVAKNAYDGFQNYKERKAFDKLRRKKQQERENEFALLRKQFPKSKDSELIISLSLEKLQEKLIQRELTSEDVLKTYIAKALEVQDEFNCITEFIPNAIEKARALDEMPTVKGPLHGIPFCVKDDTKIQGMDSTLGCIHNLYKPSSETAVIVQSLEILGAIPFCRTNVPQTCVSSGGENPIFGKTLNPLNKKLSPGGSSSGTGCLVAAGGAPFGTGSDTGGSLRIPAHFCGISTLKSTADRLSRRGCLKCMKSMPGIPGILAKRSEDVAMIMQVMTENNLQNRLDPKTVLIPWNSQVFESKQKLRIGYFASHDSYPVVGDTQSVVLNAKSFLESAGHTFIPFIMPLDTAYCTKIAFDPNLGDDFKSLLKNDKISVSIKHLYNSLCFRSSKEKMQSLWDKISGNKNNSNSKESLIKNIMSLKEEWADLVLDKMKELDIDLILSPAFPHPALEVDEIGLFFDGPLMYTFMWNILNFPAGVVKFGTESGRNWNPYANDIKFKSVSFSNWLTLVTKNGETFKGMPIGLQIIGKPYNEELVLKIMVELDEVNKPL